MNFHRQLSGAAKRKLDGRAGYSARQLTSDHRRQVSVDPCPWQFNHSELNRIEAWGSDTLRPLIGSEGRGGVARQSRPGEESMGRNELSEKATRSRSQAPSEILAEWREARSRQQGRWSLRGALSRRACALQAKSDHLRQSEAKKEGGRQVSFDLPLPTERSQKRRLTASGEFMEAPAHAFEPDTFLPTSQHRIVDRVDEDKHPSKHPAKMFRSTTHFLVFLWSFGSIMPFGTQWGRMKHHRIEGSGASHGAAPSPSFSIWTSKFHPRLFGFGDRRRRRLGSPSRGGSWNSNLAHGVEPR